MTLSVPYRPKTSDIPTAPGVYRFKAADGTVLYVGKAKSLRSRLLTYFQAQSGLHPRTAAMVNAAAAVDWVTVGNEVEALQLEWQWIKEYDPRFNVRFRDDKSYPWLAITLAEEFPRVQVMRGERRKGIRYFGPYPQASAIRESLDLLLRVFPVRTCSTTVFRRAELQQRPCLLGYIDRCSAPCVGRVSPEEHRRTVLELAAFLDGQSGSTLDLLRRQMNDAAANEHFEQAAKLRDDIASLETVMAKSAVVLDVDTDADVVGLAEDELQATVALFNVRRGRITGQRTLQLERPLEMTTPELLLQVCERIYGGESGEYVPRLLLVPVAPAEIGPLSDWLGDRRGSAVEIRVPVRGDKRALMELVSTNAQSSLDRWRSSRTTDLVMRSRALEEIRDALELAEAPLRIECIDVSHLQGADVVASLVVFEDGLPRKSDYRRYVLRHGLGNNDVASIAEIVQRRFSNSPSSPTTPPDRRFAYLPGLLVVDGGKPQVDAAAAMLVSLGVSGLPVIGLAKRLEEVWLPNSKDPVIFGRSSEALFLLQRIRDEAHRFAIGHQRQRRNRKATASVLDGIAGLGDAKTRLLMQRFRSVKRIREATREELLSIPGFGPKLVDEIHSRLHEDAQDLPSFDAATGEILEER